MTDNTMTKRKRTEKKKNNDPRNLTQKIKEIATRTTQKKLGVNWMF
jgi:uncharacterized MAPEG superfamily protein